MDNCDHVEHALRPGVGMVGRLFRDSNDRAGTWEPCAAKNAQRWHVCLTWPCTYEGHTS